VVDGNGARDPHADHDLEIVASLLDRDIVGFDRVVGEPLVQQLHEQRLADYRERSSPVQLGRADPGAGDPAGIDDAVLEPALNSLSRTAGVRARRVVA